MIRLGEPAPLARPRRLALGVDKWLALRRSAEAAGLRLPLDLCWDVDPLDADLAGLDLAAELAEATALLQEHGVLDEDGPVPAVAANLAALGTAEHRVRVSLAGSGESRLGYFWVDARLGGSLVRDGLTHTLSLYDARSFGDELLALLPEPVAHTDRRELVVPLDTVAPMAAAGEIAADVLGAFGQMLGLGADETTRLHAWCAGSRAVLHVTVAGRRGTPYALVWILGRDGWWSGRTTRPGEGRRQVVLTPRSATDLPTDLGSLVTEAWS